MVEERLPRFLRKDQSPNGSGAAEDEAWGGMVEWKGTYGGSI